jgi:hypothetical protein
MIASVLGAEGLAGQHSLCVQAAPELLLTMPSGAASSNESALFQAGVLAELDSRFALFDNFFADLSLGSTISSPSTYSDIGQRYRGFASAFGSASFGAVLPLLNHGVSIETGASFHVASWNGTQLAFAFVEIRNILRLQDLNDKPFYADFFRRLSGSGTVRAELIIPLSIQFRSDSASVSIGVGLGLRRDSYPIRKDEASDEK